MAFLSVERARPLLGVIAKLKWISIKACTSTCKSEKLAEKRRETWKIYNGIIQYEGVKIERERERDDINRKLVASAHHVTARNNMSSD